MHTAKRSVKAMDSIRFVFMTGLPFYLVVNALFLNS
jgi:hypothetical protein